MTTTIPKRYFVRDTNAHPCEIIDVEGGGILSGLDCICLRLNVTYELLKTGREDLDTARKCDLARLAEMEELRTEIEELREQLARVWRAAARFPSQTIEQEQSAVHPSRNARALTVRRDDDAAPQV